MIIGHFRYEAAADTYTGEIRTLSVQRGSVVLRPNPRNTDREPDYRVVQFGDGGTVELGAAWRRRTERGQNYLAVLLDDPTFPTAVSAALFLDDDDLSANLIWSRGARRAPAEQPRQEPQQKPSTAPAAKRRGGVRAPAGPA